MLQRLVDLRKSKNWSFQETADRLGIAKSTYAGYESGYREPSLKALLQIADLYETSVDYIMNRTDDNKKKLELVDIIDSENIELTLDNLPITNEEYYDFIAFTRLKRELKNK